MTLARAGLDPGDAPRARLLEPRPAARDAAAAGANAAGWALDRGRVGRASEGAGRVEEVRAGVAGLRLRLARARHRLHCARADAAEAAERGRTGAEVLRELRRLVGPAGAVGPGGPGWTRSRVRMD